MTVDISKVEFSSNDTPSEGSSGDQRLDVNERLEFAAGFGSPADLDLDGFNEHGIRENRTEDGELESVDVVYQAMEPGEPEDRNGVRISEEFLMKVASKEYGGEPYMLGHSDQPLDEIGKIKRVWYDQPASKMMIMNRVFNTGARTHDEVISRLTNSPPTMTDGSVGFGDQYQAIQNEAGEPELVDGRIREFSTVPFPGGYDEGGLGLPNAAFTEAINEAMINFEGHGEGEGMDTEYRDKVYDEWSSLVNMTEDEMEMWDDHPCADVGSEGTEDARDETLMLMGSPRESWRMEDVEVANRVINFLNEQMEKMPDAPKEGKHGTCPSRWAISLLNRGHNPFDSFPTGNPQFGDISVTVENIEFDDVAEEKPETGEATENSAFEESVSTKTISF